MTLRAKVLGTGSYLPPKVVTNHDLSQLMETSDEWIQQRSGIQKRHYVDAGVVTSDLAYEASVRALASAGLEASDLDMIVVATFTPDHFFPGLSSFLQRKLGLDSTPAMDVRCQCTGMPCRQLEPSWSLASIDGCWSVVQSFTPGALSLAIEGEILPFYSGMERGH